MKKYMVEYFYLATGMEGIPDRHIEGEVYAMSKEEAKVMIIAQKYSHESAENQRWVHGCLRAFVIQEEAE